MKIRSSLCRSLALFSAALLFATSISYAEEAENYWCATEKYSLPADLSSMTYMENVDSLFGTSYPKYLLKPNESAVTGKIGLGDFPYTSGIYTGTEANNSFDTLINKEIDGINYVAMLGNGQDSPSDANTEDQNWTNEKKWHDPFNWAQDSLPVFFTDGSQLQILGDIKSENSKDSTKVDEFQKGQKIALNFSVNVSPLNIWKKAYLWNMINGQSKGTAWREIGLNGTRPTDWEIVYTLKLPEGIKLASDATYTISGLTENSYTLTKEEKDGNLIFHVRKVQPATALTAKDYYARLANLGYVTLNINGFTIESSVKKNTNLQIIGTVAGMHDEVIANGQGTVGDLGGRSLNYFAAKQSPAGLDSAASKDKPNLISYTFKVKDEPSNDKLVTFINDGKFYDLVLVRADTAIKDNYSAVMPADASKEGYIFKEWNTKEDGTGTAFTNETVVHTDMTVYAIYTKQPDMVIPYVPSDPVEPATVETVVEPKVGKVAKTGETAISLTGFGLVLSLVAVLTKKKQNDD